MQVQQIENIAFGLKKNWRQFSILVFVNGLVGALIGLERSIIPELASLEFGISTHSALLSFITAFGISKAIANYFTGRLASQFGTKNLLLTGWMIAIPVPLILIYATSWNYIIAANVLLGISQGFTWSSTVIMKIDLVGQKNRGLAMGINEFAGYFALGISALISAHISEQYGVRPYPFYLGILIVTSGIFTTLLFVKDTAKFVQKEQGENHSKRPKSVFLNTTFKDKILSSVTQAGLVNNLNDGMIWGLLPIVLGNSNFNNAQIGWIAGLYPMVWGIGQLFTGKMADHYSRKSMLFGGMLLQGLAILCIPLSHEFGTLSFIAVILGLGTALVYPTFLTLIAQHNAPKHRAESVGIFRLWRDLGYAIGAITSGIIADFFGISGAIQSIGLLTILSAIIIQVRMPKNA